MPSAKRRVRGAETPAGLAQPVFRWLTDAEAVLRFERSYATRVTAYTEKVANLIKVRTLDPGEWLQEYAYFVRRVLDDAGDWMLGRDPSLGRADAVLPVYRVTLLRSEGAVSISIKVPPMVFEGLAGRDPSVVLTTEDFRVRGGGPNLQRAHIAFVPETVNRSEPHTKMKIFDVRNAVRRGNFYYGTVTTMAEERFVAAIEVEVK